MSPSDLPAALPSPVTGAQFLFEDRVLVVGAGSSLFAVDFRLHDFVASADESDRRANESAYAVAAHVPLPAAPGEGIGVAPRVGQLALPRSHITALTALNVPRSPCVVLATSDRSLHIVDLGEAGGRVARTIGPAARSTASAGAAATTSPSAAPSSLGGTSAAFEPVAARAVDHLALPRTAHANGTASAGDFHLLLAAAPAGEGGREADGGLNLWDLRTGGAHPVASFRGHEHRLSLPLGAEFSPCLRYVATGSEDQCVHVYDVRRAAPLHKLRGHRDVVVSVDLHPTKPLLASLARDGVLRLHGLA